jgi:hypothetical protein
MSAQNQKVELIEKFPLFGKILMRIGFYGYIIIGAYSIFLVNTLWAFIYIGFILLGFTFGLLYCLCSHCPYPFKYSDCLFLPSGVVKKICKFRSEPMNILEKIGFIIVIIGSVAIPQYWLFKNYLILIIFWIFCLPTLAGLMCYLCKRCHHLSCPFNLSGKKGEQT